MAAPLVDAVRAALEGRDDVALAILFGSFAKGRESSESDVDLAVEAPGADLVALQTDLEHRLARRVDIVKLADAGYPLLKAIVRDGVVVRERDHGRAAAWRARAITSLELDQPWFERMRDAYLARLAPRG